MKIIFINSDNGVSIISPSQEALQIMGIEQIALKDVPTGTPFAIVPDDFIPTDRTFRDAWVIDPSILIDGVGE